MARGRWLPFAHLRRDLRLLLVGDATGPVDDFTPYGERAPETDALPGDISVLKTLL